jgi:hypothetical protein
MVLFEITHLARSQSGELGSGVRNHILFESLGPKFLRAFQPILYSVQVQQGLSL